MGVTRVLAVLLVASAACSGGAPAPAVNPGGSEPASEQSAEARRIAAALDPYYAGYGATLGDAYAISGYVHIDRGGEVLYSRGFGLADRDARRPNTADTSFRTGSVTKQFTAAAILELAERGALSLADPIRKHLPDYPAPAGDQVTIHHLLTHTSGIPSYTAMGEVMERRDRAMTPDELLASFRDLPLEFEPGTKFVYSNSGYAVLGAIIEQVTGARYADFMAETVFGPAGLERTVAGDAEDAGDRAIGYETTPSGTVQRAPAIDMSIPYAAGSIRSTARDLVRWHRYLGSDALLEPSSREAMYTPTEVSTVAGEGATRGYGYGWSVVHFDEGDRTVIRHGGGIDGFSSSFIRIPADDLVIVAWTNNPIVQADLLGSAALTAVYGGTLAPHVEKRRVSLDHAAQQRLAGTYTLTAEGRSRALAAGIPAEKVDAIATMEARAVADTIVLVVPGETELLLFPESHHSFDHAAAGVRIEFTFDGNGPATGMLLTQGPVSLPFARASRPAPNQ